MKTMGVGLGRLFVFAYKQSVRKKNDKQKVKEPAVRKLFGRVGEHYLGGGWREYRRK